MPSITLYRPRLCCSPTAHANPIDPYQQISLPSSLWFARVADEQQRTLYRYTGHSNTTKNFVRCSFALDSAYILGGSEDGSIYIWEREPTAPSAAPSSMRTMGQVEAGGGPTVMGIATPSTPHGSPALVDANGSGNGNGNASGSGALGLSGAGPAAAAPTPLRASAAYYPKPAPLSAHAAYAHAHARAGTSVVVTPHAVLAGHRGTVCDVREGAGVVLSAAEDGVVAVWEGDAE
jgi:hypothetical protein